MRRSAYHLIAVLALVAVLPACTGQGGYGFGGGTSSNAIDNIVLTNSSGQANVFTIAPPFPLGGGIPPTQNFIDRNGLPTTPEPLVTVNAEGTRGPQMVVVPDAEFTWTAQLETNPNTFYHSGAGGNDKLCSPATPASSNTTLPDVSPFSATPVIWVQQPGGNGYQPLRPQQLSRTIYVSPGIETLVTYAPGAKNYCILLTAVGSGAQVQTEVAVTSQP